jgi:hypothetical protein
MMHTNCAAPAQLGAFMSFFNVDGPVGNIAMMRIFLIWILFGSFLISCAEIRQTDQAPHPPVTEKSGRETYVHIRNILEQSGKEIDYDTLMKTYHAMVQTRHEIPHMDRLLVSLINKRNVNPRIDQMILIFAAKALGRSHFPVPDAYGIIESILLKDDRLTEWVLAFVAEAIEVYPADIPEGDKLVDLLEEKLSMVRSASGPPKEYFGYHFLPPPKGDYIRSYIAGIQSRSLRTSERRHYYLLVEGGHAEVDIEKALRRLQSNGLSGKGEELMAPMKHLVQNPGLILRP